MLTVLQLCTNYVKLNYSVASTSFQSYHSSMQTHHTRWTYAGLMGTEKRNTVDILTWNGSRKTTILLILFRSYVHKVTHQLQ